MAKAIENKTDDLHNSVDQQTIQKELEEKYLVLFGKTLQKMTRRDKNMVMQELREISIVLNSMGLMGAKSKYAPNPQDFFLNFMEQEN